LEAVRCPPEQEVGAETDGVTINRTLDQDYIATRSGQCILLEIPFNFIAAALRISPDIAEFCRAKTLI
jgi:hypothetical protein